MNPQETISIIKQDFFQVCVSCINSVYSFKYNHTANKEAVSLNSTKFLEILQGLKYLIFWVPFCSIKQVKGASADQPENSLSYRLNESKFFLKHNVI